MKDPEGGNPPPKRRGNGGLAGPTEDSQKSSSRRGRRRRRSRRKRGQTPQVQAESASVTGQPAAPQKKSDDATTQEKPARAPGKPRRSRSRRRRKNVFVRDNSAPSRTEDADAGTDSPSPTRSRNADTLKEAASSAEQPSVIERRVDDDRMPQADVGDGTQRPPRRWRSRQVRREGHAPLYAALDLGTNNCRLLMAAPTRPGQFRVVDAFSRIVRLGEGLSRTGRLSDEAMDRAVDALHVCSGKLMARKTRGYRLIATEACRAAENGVAFIERVREETGLSLEIVNRETEARLAVAGCSSLVERETRGVVLFDIGGGSSEIALIDIPDGDPRRLSEKIVSWTSLPVGVVTLAERFDGRDVTPESFEAMVAHVCEMIDRFEGRERLAHVLADPRFHLLGTSGTVTTLAGIFLDLERYDRRRVDGIWMTGEQVTAMTERLLGWSFDQRVENPCIGADRADLVLAGCAILEAIRRTWPSERLRVADRGLREGILMQLMSRDDAWRRGRRKGERQ